MATKASTVFSPQVTQVVKTNGFSTTSTTPVDVTDLSITLTPKSINSRFKIVASLSGYADGASGACATYYLTNGSNTIFRKARISAGSESSVFAPVNLEYIDSPATVSSVTYKVRISANQYVGGNAKINQDTVNENSSFYVEEIL